MRIDARLAEQPRQLEALNLLGLTLAWSSHPDEAVRTLEQALAYAPRDLDVRFTYGRVLASAGHFDRAEEIFRRIVADQPRNLDALNLLGILQGWNGHYAEAIPTLEHALELAPADTDLRLAHATVLAWSGSLGHAEQLVRTLIAEQPKNLVARNLLGRILLLQGKYEGARAVFAEVLARAPRNTEALLGTGDVFAHLEVYPEARKSYELALQTDPKSERILKRIDAVKHAGYWRLDLGWEYSTFSGHSGRSDWMGWDAALRYALDSQTGLSVTSAWARRYGLVDQQYSLGLDRRVTDPLFVYARASFTPRADFFAQRGLAVGGEWRVRPGTKALPPTVLLFDYRISTYEPGTAHSIWLGVTQYTSHGVAVTAKTLLSRNLNGHWTGGWLARLDGDINPQWRWDLGYADTTESLSSTIYDFTRSLRYHSAFGGIYREFSPGFALRLDLAHEWSPGNPARHTLHVGIVTRF